MQWAANVGNAKQKAVPHTKHKTKMREGMRNGKNIDTSDEMAQHENSKSDRQKSKIKIKKMSIEAEKWGIAQ